MDNKKDKQEKIFRVFFLIGIIFPYIVFSISLKTANLFLWEAEERFWLLMLSPISILIFRFIGENLLIVKIFLKRFLYHTSLLLVGVYFLCSFIEAEMNILKWKFIYAKVSEDIIILMSLILLIPMIFLLIINEARSYVEKKLKEKSKEMDIKK